MKKIKSSLEQIVIAQHLLKWTFIVTPVSVVVGSLVALFLWLLQVVTVFRQAHPWLLCLLPIAGVGIYFLYRLSGKDAEKGNNLIMDEIHQPGGGVPARMTPLVLVSTLITHLFGGSAGREGTAVQMGGSMAGLIGRLLKLNNHDTTIILMVGIAAGFGAVFGTPVTGTVFALEVIALGSIRYNALIPCLVASVFADIVCTAWGIQHTHYSIHPVAISYFQLPALHVDFILLCKVIMAGLLFGLTSFLFILLQRSIKTYSLLFIKPQWCIPLCGGLLIILLCYLAGTDAYLGLGVVSKNAGEVSIVSSFQKNGIDPFSWLWKLIFTAVTLGTGFKGGEVTPLFFMGASLGNILATYIQAPVDLFAALGFIAVFAGATNTPLACTIMGIELFGGEHILYYAIACFTAYYFSGHAGIYSSQRIAVLKTGEINHKILL